MKLQEFITTAKNDLDKFKVSYENGIKNDPDCYPESLGEGDWLDQFLTYLSLNDEA